MSLLELQRRFQRALRGDTDAMEDLAPDAARRLAVHRTTIETGLVQTLLNAFPVLARIVGAPTFMSLSLGYIADTPPRHPVLSTYGRGFPAYAAAQPIAASLPYLHDIARLEWARQEAYFAGDARLLDAGALDTDDAETVSALQLRVHPAVRVISSPFPIHSIWRVNQADVETKDIPAIDMRLAEHVIVTRPAHEIVTRPISLADATLVRAVMGGAHLGAAVESAFALAADFDVTQALARHFANGTFRALAD
ncbi:MAG: putative DNA-binding domain-containing protein [Rhodospirillaceae bacterium]